MKAQFMALLTCLSLFLIPAAGFAANVVITSENGSCLRANINGQYISLTHRGCNEYTLDVYANLEDITLSNRCGSIKIKILDANTGTSTYTFRFSGTQNLASLINNNRGWFRSVKESVWSFFSDSDCIDTSHSGNTPNKPDTENNCGGIPCEDVASASGSGGGGTQMELPAWFGRYLAFNDLTLLTKLDQGIAFEGNTPQNKTDKLGDMAVPRKQITVATEYTNKAVFDMKGFTKPALQNTIPKEILISPQMLGGFRR